MDEQVYGCEGGRLARAVESADWPCASGASSGWACPTCRRLAEVVLPYLLALERRIQHLEGGITTPVVRPAPAATSQLARGERDALIAALQQARGIQKHAATVLGISERMMSYRVKKHGLADHCAIPKARRRTKESTA